MVHVLARITALPASADTMREILVELAAQTRKEAGLLALRVVPAGGRGTFQRPSSGLMVPRLTPTWRRLMSRRRSPRAGRTSAPRRKSCASRSSPEPRPRAWASPVCGHNRAAIANQVPHAFTAAVHRPVTPYRPGDGAGAGSRDLRLEHRSSARSAARFHRGGRSDAAGARLLPVRAHPHRHRGARRFAAELWLRVRSRTYETTLTRPDLFADYYLEQFRLLLRNHHVSLEVGTSSQPIPVHFSFAEMITSKAR